jgi:hypothetical protein
LLTNSLLREIPLLGGLPCRASKAEKSFAIQWDVEGLLDDGVAVLKTKRCLYKKLTTV